MSAFEEFAMTSCLTLIGENIALKEKVEELNRELSNLANYDHFRTGALYISSLLMKMLSREFIKASTDKTTLEEVNRELVSLCKDQQRLLERQNCIIRRKRRRIAEPQTDTEEAAVTLATISKTPSPSPSSD